MAVTKRRNAQSERRFLYPAEVALVLHEAGQGRHKDRDRAICCVLAYQGLRVSELCGLRMSDLRLEANRIYVRRLKGSEPGEQPLLPQTLKALYRYLKKRPESPFTEVFLTERGEPFSRNGILYLVAKWGEKSALPLRVHPHMLRHSCGFRLANLKTGSRDVLAIKEFFGHRSISSTLEYAKLDLRRFDDLLGLT